MNLSVDRIVEVTGGTLLRSAESVFTSCTIDSRKARHGTLFFAMKGGQTDGHLFVRNAAENGASGAIVEHAIDSGDRSITIIQVPDSMRALQEMAASARSASAARFIGITGSAGKTSTKEFTAALLSEKYRVYKSEGNLNSITGMPLSLLAMEDPECAVFEVGMSEPGEIAGLAALLQPHVRVLLNVNPVHLGQFDSVDAIADEKSLLLQGISHDNWIIVNADDNRLLQRVAGYSARKLSYGYSNKAQLRIANVESRGVRGQNAEFHYDGRTHKFQTALAGAGNLYNIAAAACVALACGLQWDQILSGIGKLRPYSQRGVLISQDGFDIYDDSYNSNPAALEFALELIGQSTGYKRKIAILGDMLELGPQESEFHYAAGKSAASQGIDVLITAGPRSRHMAQAAREDGMGEVLESKDSTDAAAIAKQLVREGDLVLVKGSRGIKMENVVHTLVKS